MGAIPKFRSVFCLELRTGGIVLACCEIAIGVICTILGVVAYATQIGDFIVVPASVWLMYGILNFIRLVAYICFLYGLKEDIPICLMPALIVSVINIFIIIPFISTVVKVLALYLESKGEFDDLPANYEWHFVFCILLFSLITLNMYLYAVQFTIYKFMKKGQLPRKEQPVV